MAAGGRILIEISDFRSPGGGHLLQLLGNGGDLLDAILVGGQVRLKGFVLLLQGLQLVELALAEVLRLQHLLLATRPVLVGISLGNFE